MKIYGQSILLLLLLSQVTQATMVITFGVPVTKVNGVVGSYYTPGDSIGLLHQVSFANGSNLARSMRADIALLDKNDNGICTAFRYEMVVSANDEHDYDPDFIEGMTTLGSFHTAVLWGSYFDATWHLMTTDSYDFTQGM